MAAALIAALLWLVLEVADHTPGVLVTLGLLSALYTGLARLSAGREPLAIIAAVLCVLTLASREVSWSELTEAATGDPGIGLPPAAFLPQELVRAGTELFERHQRSEKALLAALAEMYVEGVSTRKVKAITEELCDQGFSASAISEIKLWLDASLPQFARRRLGSPTRI